MGISDVFGGMKGERYRKERAYTVGASPSFFDLKPSGDDLSVSDMIMTSTTKESFSKKMNLALRYHGDADPVDFSLAIGKFTGVYNLYPSYYLTEEVKREIASMDVDPNKTRAFLNRHFNSMATYFQKAYHIHASEDNLTLHISELTSDYTAFTGRYVRLFPAGHNEAPTICKYQGKYYMITSGCTGWAPNQARSFSADHIFGPWTSLGDPCEGDAKRTTFDSQGTFLLSVAGKPETFIFMADRWNPKNPVDGRYVWLPVYFENGRIVLRWHNVWEY